MRDFFMRFNSFVYEAHISQASTLNWKIVANLHFFEKQIFFQELSFPFLLWVQNAVFRETDYFLPAFSDFYVVYRHHIRGIFHPFHAFVSRCLCPNAKNRSKTDCPITEKHLEGSIQHFFTHAIFRLDARAVKRFRGCVANFILVDIHS